MKKLLALLGSLTLATSGSLITVSCNKYDQKTKSGDSILINFLESLTGSDGESKTQLDASDVLLRLINESGPNDRQKFVNDLTNLLDTSILSNVSSIYGGKNSKLKKDSPFYDVNLVDNLAQSYTSINSAADAQIAREKANYKHDYGWRWSGKWKDYLAGKFPLYQSSSKNADVNFLEKKYKASLLLTSTDFSASATLSKILLSTDQYGVTWVDPDTIKSNFEDYKASKDQNAWINNNKIIAAQIFNSTIDINSVKGDDIPTSWIAPNEVSGSLLSKVKEEMIINYVPTDISKYTSSGAVYRRGYLSNMQKFIAEKWYETKAPLATSFIKFPFATNYEFKTGITEKSFEGIDGKESAEINSFVKFLMTGSSDGKNLKGDTPSTDGVDPAITKRWQTIMSDTSTITAKYPDAAPTVNTQLMTLSNSTDYEQDVRSAVYDFVFSKIGDSKSSSASATELDGTATEETIVKAITRDKSQTNNFYVAFKNSGIIALVTANGLLFYHIDGFDQLLATKGKQDDKDHKDKASKNIKDGKIDADTLKELETFRKFYSETDSEKVQDVQINYADDKKNSTYTNLNNTVKNEYLKWLLNNSLLANVSGSATKFGVMDSVEKWATQTSSPSVEGEYEWTIYIIDYFREVTNFGDKKGSYKDFIDLFIEWGDKNNSDQVKKIANSLDNWYSNAVETISSVIQSNSSQSFVKSLEDWKETIDKEGDSSTTKYPKQIIVQEDFGETILAEKASTIWWTPKLGSESDK